MRYRIIRHPLVDRDIARIAAFLLEHTTLQSVSQKIAALDADVNGLGEHPHRGTRRDEILSGLRAIPSAGRGVIAFQVKEEIPCRADSFDHLGRCGLDEKNRGACGFDGMKLHPESIRRAGANR